MRIHTSTDIPSRPHKPLRWLGSSRRDLRSFTPSARNRAGFELWLVQRGAEPSDWRPMPMVGHGVRELRIHEAGEHRMLYLASLPEAIYVLHAFHKKTERTRWADLELARKRLRELNPRAGGAP